MVTNLSVYSEAANTFLGAQVCCAITPNGGGMKRWGLWIANLSPEIELDAMQKV